MSDIIINNVDLLRQKSLDVVSVLEAQSIISTLKQNLEIIDGYGLSAIQIGIPKKLSIIKCPKKINNDGYIYLINSEIIEKEESIFIRGEGCLSFPGKFANTTRYKQITIKNNVIEENNFREQQEVYYYSFDAGEIGNDGLVAIAIQHEMDHWEGKIILDYDIITSSAVKSDKIGRNEKCPCGSGKKYKKCCGN